MRVFLCALSAGVFLACAAASCLTASDPVQLPYTAHYKLTTVQKLPDGSTKTTESTMVEAIDLHGRMLITYADSSGAPGGQARTDFHIRDKVNLTSTSWSVPGTTAQVVHMPDLGEPETDCAKKMKAIDALHPAGQTLPIKDLGTKTIRGLEAHGGQVTFTTSFMRPGMPRPATRTNEVWTAVDPRLGKLVVRTISTTSQGVTTTQELVKFTQAEPDPKLFKIPPDRQVTKREGQAYICGIRPQPRPAPAQ